jgi:hypothetical protein
LCNSGFNTAGLVLGYEDFVLNNDLSDSFKFYYKHTPQFISLSWQAPPSADILLQCVYVGGKMGRL